MFSFTILVAGIVIFFLIIIRVLWRREWAMLSFVIVLFLLFIVLNHVVRPLLLLPLAFIYSKRMAERSVKLRDEKNLPSQD
ncbi:hypothetical protein [Priestia koreensis]|uniref:hypothetical protein n=1 Tax=Priestia koreensis TaxID=284581 RepID=UPI00345B1A3E